MPTHWPLPGTPRSDANPRVPPAHPERSNGSYTVGPGPTSKLTSKYAGPLRGGQAWSHADQHRVREPRVVEIKTARDVLPAGVELEGLYRSRSDRPDKRCRSVTTATILGSAPTCAPCRRTCQRRTRQGAGRGRRDEPIWVLDLTASAPAKTSTSHSVLTRSNSARAPRAAEQQPSGCDNQ